MKIEAHVTMKPGWRTKAYLYYAWFWIARKPDQWLRDRIMTLAEFRCGDTTVCRL